MLLTVFCQYFCIVGVGCRACARSHGLYAGYNDDLNYDSRHPFTRDLVPGFRRNARTFFIKASYLIRRGF